MRNRNHTLPLVAVGIFIVCSSPSGASEPSATGAAKDHDCSLPANIRDKVEHCNQVGDFGGPHRDAAESKIEIARRFVRHQKVKIQSSSRLLRATLRRNRRVKRNASKTQKKMRLWISDLIQNQPRMRSR